MRATTRLALVGVGMLVLACEKSNTVNTTNNNYTTINNISQAVGASGARLMSPGGAVADIPAGALSVETTLSIGEVQANAATVPALPQGRALRSPIFAFEPHGQTFAMNVTLTLPHTAGTDAVQILRADPNGAWTPVGAVGGILNGRAQGETRAFSFYAVFSGGVTGGNGPADAGVAVQDCGTCSSGLVCACRDYTTPSGGCEGGPPMCRDCNMNAEKQAADQAKNDFDSALLRARRCQMPSECSTTSRWDVPGLDCHYLVVTGTDTSELTRLWEAYLAALRRVPSACASTGEACGGTAGTMATCDADNLCAYSP